jgi:hypothetical protein
MNKIYLVAGGEYSDYHIAAAFKDREKAEFYVELQNKLDSFCDYYVDERELYDEIVTMNEKVVTYYNVSIYTTTGELDHEWDNQEIYTKDVIIEKEEHYPCIRVSSTKSFEHARKVAIEQYQIYTQQLLEDGN